MTNDVHNRDTTNQGETELVFGTTSQRARRHYQPPLVLSAEPLEVSAGKCSDPSGGGGKITDGCDPDVLGS